MCGRYALYSPAPACQAHFGTQGAFDMAPRFNIAPSQSLPVVCQTPSEGRHFLSAKWGLIPSWVKNPEEMPQPINAKAETAAIKPMFRHAFRKSRILVPADAFYEWKAVNGRKQPYLVRLRDGSPFGMAGLLEHWQGPAGTLATFTILTTEPNALMADIHNRMPAIVKPEDYQAWLDPDLSDVEELQRMVVPYPERFMEAYPVSRKVNNPANEGPDLLERETPAET